jgi:hypothetical protein
MKVRCVYCSSYIELNQDSEESRKSHTDPHQQMRRHIESKHMREIMNHSRQYGWVLDMLFFESPDDPAQWQDKITKTLLSLQATAKGRSTK